MNAHSELRFPMNLASKPPWSRVVLMSEEQEKIEYNHRYLLRQHMTDFFDADTASLLEDRETPATFVPLARSHFLCPESSTAVASASNTTGSMGDGSADGGGDEEIPMEMSAEDEAMLLGRAQPASGEA